MRPGKIALAVVGALVALTAVGLIAGGGGLLWANATQRTGDGFFTSPTVGMSIDSYAVTAPEIDLGSQPGDWFPSGRLATVRVEVDPQNETPVFVGIGPAAEVDAYLDEVAHDQVTEFGPNSDDVVYRSFPGEAPTGPPSEQTFWAVSAEGAGTQTLTWDLEQGRWAVVIMNADASAGIEVETSAAASTDLLVPLAVGLVVLGLILGALSAGLLVLAFRRTGDVPDAADAASPTGFRPYPVRLEGQPDPDLSRWQWLVKWFLAIPHYIVLFFLWAAFAVLTLAAFFAILFTGRYPRRIFDFNVGVMRWTWRVGFYSYSALGTDEYPPFTLDEVDYPARFDVAYPEQLSRGLALVKWWLLAIPHYLIVGLFTSGLVWWTTELNQGGDAVLQIGGGLIGILVLIAGFALLFTGRYPKGLFDLVVGLNRWVFRVWAYAGLMRDEYPPFRLDTGGSEPGTGHSVAPSTPSNGGDVSAGHDPNRL